jgi:hypothetical protein
MNGGDVGSWPILLQKSGLKGVSAVPWIFRPMRGRRFPIAPRGAAALTL